MAAAGGVADGDRTKSAPLIELTYINIGILRIGTAKSLLHALLFPLKCYKEPVNVVETHKVLVGSM